MESPESISDQPELRTRTGIGLEELCTDSHIYHSSLQGKEPVPWDDLDMQTKSRWIECVSATFEFLAQEIECKWVELAKMAARAYYGADHWNALSTEEKLAFEVIVRNLCNMVHAEDDVDLKSAREYNWGDWAIRNLPPLPN